MFYETYTLKCAKLFISILSIENLKKLYPCKNLYNGTYDTSERLRLCFSWTGKYLQYHHTLVLLHIFKHTWIYLWLSRERFWNIMFLKSHKCDIFKR